MLPTIATGNVSSALTGEYEVANSLRFDDGSDHNLERTQDDGNKRTWTTSWWVKRTNLDINTTMWDTGTSGGNNYTPFFFQSNNTIRFYEVIGGSLQSFNFITNRVFRDTLAWYHIVYRVDTTQSTEADRVRLYINGVQETSFSTSAYPALNYDTAKNNSSYRNTIGTASDNNGNDLDAYLAEFVHVDGQSLDPTSFGEFDSDSPNIWKPIDVSGLTFGTNGFYLDFENASSLGADVSGNSNNFTVNNLTSVDQSTDTCTNNFATINSLENYYTPHTLSEGNLRQTTASSNLYAPSISTIALSQGKWYFECKYVSRSSSDNYNLIGVKSTQVTNTNYLGQNQHDYGYYSSSGKYYTNGSAVTYGDSYDQGDIIGVYLDLDNNKLYFAKNGALQNSGTGISITDPASTPLGHYFFATGDYGSSLVIVNDWNFGGTQSFSISSGNTDPNGYGNFEYDPSSGTFDGGSKSFYALNTKNLAEFG